MSTIISGLRDFDDYDLLKDVIKKSTFKITEVVSGQARGVDDLGEKWAKENNLPISLFPADWHDLSVPGAVIKTNGYGQKYNILAGFQQNEKMVNHSAIPTIDR